MRKLMWFSIGFGGACAFCAYLWLTEGLLLPAAAAGILSVFLIAGGRWTKLLRIAGAICLGCGVGLAWFQFYASGYLSLAARMDGQLAEVTARCTDYSYQTGYGTGVEAYLYLDGKPFRAKLYVEGEMAMEPGDVVEGVFSMQVTTADGENAATYHQGKGIFLLCHQEEAAVLQKLSGTPYWAYPAIWRKNLKNLMDSCFPEDTASFAKALLLGDRTGIDYETSSSFRISGIMHIIAVSGLHVTILFTLIHNFCLRRRWLVALLGIPAMVLFAAVAGFSPSVTRAAIMMILTMLAMLFDRDYDGPTELAFSCLVMLLVNPLVITSVSFQLSVGCMAGIFLFRNGIHDYLAEILSCGRKGRLVKLKRWIVSSVSVTLSAMSLTTPLVACYFGAVSLVGVLTNLLTLWVISFIFYGVMLVCLLGFLWPGVAAAFAWAVSWPIRYVLMVAKVLSSFPLAAVYTRSVYIVAWLVFCYVLLVIFWFTPRKKPKTLLCCMVLGLCLALAASWGEVMTDACRMTVLNVGQGQSILLQSGGKTYLVDCGGSDEEAAADLAADTLLSQGISRLDGIILTHFDRDHAGGVFYLLSRIPADVVFVPDCEDENNVTGRLEERIPGQVIPVRKDLSISYGNTEMTVFGPVQQDSGNENSLAVLFRSGDCDILITGDRSSTGEWVLLKSTDLPELEILVVGHHGARDSCSRELLQATMPKTAVISVGENPYGHPAQEVLDRLEEISCIVYRTDIHGNLTFRR